MNNYFYACVFLSGVSVCVCVGGGGGGGGMSDKGKKKKSFGMNEKQEITENNGTRARPYNQSFLRRYSNHFPV